MTNNGRKRVTVIGAGFSGLTTASYLLAAGHEVRVFERNDKAGGLIGTRRTPHGLVETAANGILNSARFERLCNDAGIRMIEPRSESRARYLWRSGPRRYPFTVGETLRIGAGLLLNAGAIRPKPGETVSQWGGRLLGRGATQYGLVTILGGIYAGDGDRMSASLIFGRRAPGRAGRFEGKPVVRGTVAPATGMQELIDGLAAYVGRLGGVIEYGRSGEVDPDEPTVICVSASQAAGLLRDVAPDVAACLDRIEMLSLVTATCFYEPRPDQLNGFGCLFPRGEGFRARGVLLNDSIFDGRSSLRSETWILGGALDPNVVDLGDDELKQVIAADHERFTGRVESPLSIEITRWPHALPHYDLTLERMLPKMPVMPGRLVLAGNYLAGIGLAKLLDRSADAAAEINEMP